MIRKQGQFEQRLKETKRKAIEENIKKAQETGNKLSQNIDKDETCMISMLAG